MRVIGLTGGTGSGKSTVSKIVADMGMAVIDADIVAREIVQKGEKALEEICKTFGTDVLLEDGALNRKKLGSIVFADKDKLKLLNGITHKYIVNRIKQKIDMERQKGAYYIIIDAAILIESGLYIQCDEVWVVIAHKDQRLKRIMQRDSLLRKDALNRMNAQMPEEEMKEYASAVINNSKDLDHLRMQIMQLMNKV